jgi:hypothetical protein
VSGRAVQGFRGRSKARLAALGIAAIAALAGCPKPAPETPPDAGSIGAAIAIDAGVGIDAGAVDAGPPIPGELPFTLIATRADGGTEDLRIVEGRAELDPARGFDLAIPVALKDYRVRLMDWADQIVPADEVATAADGGVAYRIDLLQPLHTGRTYLLQIDAEFGPEITDTAGRTWDDVRVHLAVRGEIEPAPGKAPKKPAPKPAPKPKK